jgi:hypothetical protein
MFQMMGVFAEFERAMICERVKSGLERAKAQGKRSGHKRIDASKEREFPDGLANGSYPPLCCPSRSVPVPQESAMSGRLRAVLADPSCANVSSFPYHAILTITCRATV